MLTLASSPSAAMRSIVATYAAARSAMARSGTASPSTSRVALSPPALRARTAATAWSGVVPATDRSGIRRRSGVASAARATQRRLLSQRKRARRAAAIMCRADRGPSRGRARRPRRMRSFPGTPASPGSYVRGASPEWAVPCRIDVRAVDPNRRRAAHAEQCRVLFGSDRDHLDRCLEGVLGEDLDEVLASRHRGRVPVGEEKLDPHRTGGLSRPRRSR